MMEVNDVVFISRGGRVTGMPRWYRQQVGVVKTIGLSGTVLFNPGPVFDLGGLIGYAQNSGGLSVYTTSSEPSGAPRRQVYQEPGLLTRPQAFVSSMFHNDEVVQGVDAFYALIKL